jgi:competence protein ComEA
MSRSDWVALPGIGKKLAENIHIDRQKNGDFGSLDALKRVKGVGPGRIAA